jgi:hypothetical protein
MTTMRQFGGPLASGVRQRAVDPVTGRGSDQPGGSGAFYPGGPGSGRVQGSYNATHAGSNGAAPGWATDTIRNRWTDALNRSGSVAEQAEGAYLDRATNFNAQDYMRQAASGAFADFLPELERSIGEMRGAQVGMGRLNTGFATEDEDRLVSLGMEDLNQKLSQMALQAGGLQLENDQGLARFGAEYGGRYLDLMTGQYDAKTAETNAKKRKFWDDLGGAAQVAGSAAMFL